MVYRRHTNFSIEEIQQNSVKDNTKNGVLFASVETPVMAIGVKYEYVEYVKRYGPPSTGGFDPVKLQNIRAELGITNDPSVTL